VVIIKVSWFLDAARALINGGVDRAASIELWHGAASDYARRALLTGDDSIVSTSPRFVSYQPWQTRNHFRRTAT